MFQKLIRICFVGQTYNYHLIKKFKSENRVIYCINGGFHCMNGVNSLKIKSIHL
jgi:hypothetical protein